MVVGLPPTIDVMVVWYGIALWYGKQILDGLKGMVTNLTTDPDGLELHAIGCDGNGCGVCVLVPSVRLYVVCVQTHVL